MDTSQTLLLDSWKDFTLSEDDLEFINNYLFEVETPLTEAELAPLVIEQRLRRERQQALERLRAGSRMYLPKETYSVGEKVIFPALGWKKGEVVHVRPGVNPEIGDFDVIEVRFEDGSQKAFAARLANHKLNDMPQQMNEADSEVTVEKILALYETDIQEAIQRGLQSADGLVRIAGRWFPRALLVDINIGHLNLAEAILDEKQGGPLPTSALMEQVELPAGVNPKLLEFSMNYALQEDDRFDEVGPAGQVLWYLRRMEPENVQNVPAPLRYTEIPYDRSVLTAEMLAFEASLDDELSPISASGGASVSEVTIALTYPHWRAGTLPISARTRHLFPTAYESPRVLFQVVDAHTKEEMVAWVVRPHGYVVGLESLYKKYNLYPGSLITLRRGKPGQVVVEARLRRPVRDWVRTLLVGSDGELVFATLKQNLTTEYNEQMLIVVPDVAAVDEAREKIARQRLPFGKLVENVMRDLSKLNVQGHVHVLELYSALNVVRRCPPGPLLALLATDSNYRHVGDLYFRLNETESDYE